VTRASAAAPAPAPADGPTATALAELRAFLSRAVGAGHAVDVAVPDDNHGTRLCVWPVALLPDLGTRGGYGKQTLRLRARHVVTADGGVEQAVALLDRVLVATVDEDRYQLVLEPVPPGLWGAATPRPSVLIDVPVQITAATTQSPRVTGGLRIGGGGLRIITGTLYGPGDVAMPAMTVASPTTGTSTITDTRGGFVLPGQPADRAVLLQLSGRGLHLQVEVGPEATDPVVIHCPIEEV